MIYLTKEQYFKIINHAKQQYPREACGILAGGKNGRVEEVYRMTNISETPEIFYFMKPEEQLKVLKEIRQKGFEMVGIYHSHSQSPAYPSSKDCEMAFYPEVDYVIVSLKNFNNPEVRSFKIKDGKINEEKIKVRKNILFVCIENSCRSQMAEGIAKGLYWQEFNAYSAGSRPSGKVNPEAVEVMKEIGIDISRQKSKGFEELKDMEFDFCITMGCGDECPFYPAEQRLDWQIEDPKGKPVDYFRKTRDAIRRKIEDLVKTL